MELDAKCGRVYSLREQPGKDFDGKSFGSSSLRWFDCIKFAELAGAAVFKEFDDLSLE
jgi:hypothetical protein